MTAAKPQVQIEIRPRCPKHGTLLDLRTGRCVLFDHYPSQEQEASVGDVATLHSESRVDTYDTETGEIQGQLLLGIDVPTVAVQRRGERTMTISEFNRQVWDFNEGDRLTVTCKDGRLAVKVKTGWEAE